MAKKKSEYPTSFKTFDEFTKALESIPRENLGEWAENLDQRLLRIKDKNDWTVAHLLAKRGVLSGKWMTDELLRMKNHWGRTVAHALAESGTLPEEFFVPSILSVADRDGKTPARHLLSWIVRSDRWDMLTPALLVAPYSATLSIAAFLRRKFVRTETGKLNSILGCMTMETKTVLLSGSRTGTASKILAENIDRETERDIFKTPSDGNNTCDSPLGGQNPLYGGRNELYEAGR